jgi:hypothetical protein
VRNRVVLLLVGNLALLGYILWRTSQTAEASFGGELERAASNDAPYVLAGFGLTGIVFTGAIDL